MAAAAASEHSILLHFSSALPSSHGDVIKELDDFPTTCSKVQATLMRNHYITISSLAGMTSAATKRIQICVSLSPNESHQIKESTGFYFRTLEQKNL